MAAGWSGLFDGIQAGLQTDALMFIALGTLIGVLVGAAPGIGPTVGMSVMLPIAIRLSPENAIFLLMAISVGAAFGNSFPAILVRVPGTPSALLTVIEGYPFFRRGEAGRALQISLVSSVIGQFAGVIMFILFVIPLADVAIRLLFPEVFAIVVFGIVTAAGLVTKSPWKGVAAIALGLLLAIPGQDAITGQTRFTFGSGYLQQGLPIVPVVVGLLAFREVFGTAEKGVVTVASHVKRFKIQRWLTAVDAKSIAIPVVIGTIIGVLIGIVPGAGGAVASFVAYQVIKIVLRKKRDWGEGSPEGLATVDSSANSSTVGELIPTLALGIPGAPTMVVLMSALAAQGIYAGPQLVQTRPELLYATFGGLLVGVAFLALIGYLCIPPSIYVTLLSPAGTMAVSTVLIITGAFALRWQMLDVWACLAAGVLGYLLERFGYPVAPAALAFILGGMLERSLRRGLVMTGGWLEFVSRPITAMLLVLAIIAFVGGIAMNRRLAISQREHIAGQESRP